MAEVDKVGRNLGLVGLVQARQSHGAVSGRRGFDEEEVVWVGLVMVPPGLQAQRSAADAENDPFLGESTLTL